MKRIILIEHDRRLDSMTIPQLERLYRKAYAKMDRYRMDGGSDMFGWWDWPTLRVCRPGWYKTLREIRSALNRAILRWHWEHVERYAEYGPLNTEEV